MIDDAKKLLDSMGVPWIQAPSEGEAQAAYIVSRGHVWAAASQDYDSLLFGAPTLVRNLTVSGRRKLPGKNLYVEVEPEVIHLEKVLDGLGVTREQLIDVAILLGTDFNPGGFRGVGPKTALKLIKESGTLERAVERLRQDSAVEELLRVRQIFLDPKVTDDYRIEWRRPDHESTINFLCRERGFSEERVRNALERLSSGFDEGRLTLESFFRD
jgi:flap endonuclease-1